ncbi:MAG: hypothetical protein QOE96_218 [Blastocatellia bacterium]|jgi:hypothetical protein|nr:hypothetical protein [Blastocatellia bacterium]
MQSSDSSTNAKIEAVLRFIAVAWCAIFIFTPSIWYIILVARLIHPSLISDDPGIALGKEVPFLVLVVGIELFYGVAFARFLLRLIPSEPSKGDRGRHSLRLLLLGGSLSPLVLLFLLLIPSAKIALAISATLWLAFVLASLLSANRKLKRLSPDRFVLFLRRFSTFSERAIFGLVLSSVPRDRPLIFLTPNQSRPSDWNPFLISFAGLKLARPLSNLPVVLRAPDADWERPAKSLIDDAHRIVLDISAGSAAIQTEMMMIQHASRWHDTICVKDRSTAGNPALDDFILAKDGWLVAYKKNWSQVLPRLFLFILFSVISLFWLASIVTERSHPSSEFEKLLATFTAVILWAVPFLSGLGLLVYSTFIYPSITVSAKPAIRRALRGVPSDERLIRSFGQHHQEFERLIKMSLEDLTNEAATSLRVITAEPTSNKEQLMLSSERRDQYGELFKSLRLGHGMRLHSTDFILLACQNNIVGRSGCEKGYVYTTSPLKPLYNSLDIQSARGRYLYRELKPNWYLYLFEK